MLDQTVMQLRSKEELMNDTVRELQQQIDMLLEQQEDKLLDDLPIERKMSLISQAPRTPMDVKFKTLPLSAQSDSGDKATEEIQQAVKSDRRKASISIVSKQ